MSSSSIAEIKKLYQIGKYNQALEKIPNLPESEKAFGIILESQIYERQGNLNKASELVDGLILEIGDDDDSNYLFIARVMKASISFRSGNRVKTEQSLQLASKFVATIRNSHDPYLLEVLGNYHKLWGNLYGSQGKFLLAYKAFDEALVILKNLDLHSEIGGVYHNIGMLYGFQGEFEKAMEMYNLALEIVVQQEHKGHVAFCLQKLVLTNLNLNNLSEAKEKLAELKIIADSTDNKLTLVLHQYAHAMVLKNSRRISQRFESQKHFREIIENDVVNHITTMGSMMNLCETLLEEIKISMDEEIVNEILEISKSIFDLANEIKSIPVIVEVLILQSKFSLINGEFVIADEILEQALSTAEHHNLTFYAEQVVKAREELRSEYTKWIEIIEKGAPLREKLYILDVKDYLTELNQWILSETEKP